jgi:hypothetical protein
MLATEGGLRDRGLLPAAQPQRVSGQVEETFPIRSEDYAQIESIADANDGDVARRLRRIISSGGRSVYLFHGVAIELRSDGTGVVYGWDTEGVTQRTHEFVSLVDRLWRSG